MRPSRLLLLLLASLVLAPFTARAADVPVTYTVDTTALKLAISGTNLTFQLYTDGACTSLAHTQVLTVDNTNLLSVLKRSKPKNGVKPPKTTDVRATLTGVGPAAPLYLKVTGTGITPIGGACQVQASTTVGQSGVNLVLKDANGVVVGPLEFSGNAMLSDGGVLVLGYVPPAGFNQFTQFFYTSTDCSGPKLYQAFLAAGGYAQYLDGVDGTTLYHGPATGPVTAYNSYDYAPEIPTNCTGPGQLFNLPNRCCCTSPTCTVGSSTNLGPPSTMDVSGFVPPFSASLQ
jgi:hypothetical protein